MQDLVLVSRYVNRHEPNVRSINSGRKLLTVCVHYRTNLRLNAQLLADSIRYVTLVGIGLGTVLHSDDRT